MITCDECGTENADDAEFCKKCGDSLQAEKIKQRSKDCFGGPGRPEEECIGLPYGGALCGAIFGLIIIVLGWSMIIGFNFWWWIGPTLLGIFGVLVIIGAIYSISRRRKSGE